jgi:hypothetical protein
MSDTLEKLAASGDLTPEQIDRVGRKIAELVKEAQTDPLFQEELEKVAFGTSPTVQKLVGMFGSGLALGGGVMGGSHAVSAIAEKLRDRREAIEKATRYQEMVAANPELSSSSVDAKMVQRHFDTLHRFNPEYASDPMVAGAYVLNSLSFARPDINTVNNVVRARSDITQAKKNIPAPGQAVLQGAEKITKKMLM